MFWKPPFPKLITQQLAFDQRSHCLLPVFLLLGRKRGKTPTNNCPLSGPGGPSAQPPFPTSFPAQSSPPLVEPDATHCPPIWVPPHTTPDRPNFLPAQSTSAPSKPMLVLPCNCIFRGYAGCPHMFISSAQSNESPWLCSPGPCKLVSPKMVTELRISCVPISLIL